MSEGRISGFGASLERFESLGSTQDVAKERAAAGAPEGTVIVAGVQGRGRGRLGRHWFSPPGGLWFSVVLRPQVAASRISGITLMAAVAVAKAIGGTTRLDAGIKWPNDILLGGRKVAGILTEASVLGYRVNFVTLGIGINANVDVDAFPHDLLMPATSLAAELDREVDLDELLTACIKALGEEYERFAASPPGLLEEWRRRSVTLGRRVRVTQSGSVVEGEALDVDEAGALLVRDDRGDVREVRAGDLTILR